MLVRQDSILAAVLSLAACGASAKPSGSALARRNYPHLRKPAYYLGRDPAGFTMIPNRLPQLNYVKD